MIEIRNVPHRLMLYTKDMAHIGPSCCHCCGVCRNFGCEAWLEEACYLREDSWGHIIPGSFLSFILNAVCQEVRLCLTTCCNQGVLPKK